MHRHQLYTTLDRPSPRSGLFRGPLSLLCLALLFCTAAFFPPGSSLAADQQLTLVLPVKINAGQTADLTRLADSILADVLRGASTTSEQFRFMSRAEAEASLDYRGSWPPPYGDLEKLLASLDATGARADFVAAGSLTELGKQFSLDIRVFDRQTPDIPTYYYQGATLSGDYITAGDLNIAMTAVVADIQAYTGRDYRIAAVRPQGNERIDSGAILRQIKTRSGDRYDPDSLRADLKNVFKMGYFDDVRVETANSEKGRIISFVVTEKPVIRTVEIIGANELKEDTVRDAVTIVPSTIVNPGKVKEAAESIRLLYKSKGFYNTTVDAKLSYPQPERVDVQFVIEEGAKVFIKKVAFAGNTAFKDKVLAKVIETSERGLFSWITESGFLRRDILDQDVARITAFYHNHGFIEAKVGEPIVRQEGEWLYVTFNIAEGPRYRVGKVTLTGDMITEQQTLQDLLKVGSQEYLSRKTLRQDILRLTDYYAENGYAFAEAQPAISKSDATHTVDITISIHQGNLVHLNRILITGNTRTRDKVIRREMAVQEGGIFNSKGLRTSNQRLLRLDYFEEVNINTEPTPGQDKMDVIVAVKEKPTGAFSIGAGYSSVDQLMVMGEISQNNFLGKGQRLSLQANLSGTATRYNLGFTEPHFLDTKLLTGLDLYNWERKYDDYTKDSFGGAIRLGYPIWEKWQTGFSYGYDHTDLTDVDLTNVSLAIKQSLDIKITSFVKFSLGRDTRDRPSDVSKGSQNSISVKYAGGPLGGDSQFTKVEGSTSWYFPIFLGTTFHLRGVAGQVFENEAGKLPVYEKFYLGGINTIRGFESGQISPTQLNDSGVKERVGGERMWYANVEWLFPLVKEAGLKGVIFFDAGNVYQDSWDFNEVKKSVGLGFRWLSPMGPLRLEWGYNLDPVNDEPDSVWDFSIGGGF